MAHDLVEISGLPLVRRADCRSVRLVAALLKLTPSVLARVRAMDAFLSASWSPGLREPQVPEQCVNSLWISPGSGLVFLHGFRRLEHLFT